MIDEPELSLHPAWQIKYINTLKKLFKDFSSSHYILASHSHFMVSDLKADSSSLIGFMNTHINDRKKQCEYIDSSTYAWSAENILYRVFKLRTTRNHYFETELQELISLITNSSQNKARIEELTSSFSDYIVDKNDPLVLLLEESNEYLKSI